MDKIDRLLDAIKHPERYSDAQLEDMLRDPEVKEVFTMLDKTKSSLRPIADPDVDAEWQAFEQSHPSRRFSWTAWFSRNIAASIAIGAVSLAAVAALIGVGVHQFSNPTTEKPREEVSQTVSINDKTEQSTKSETTATEVVNQAPEVVIFDNEPLETMIGSIAGFYGYQVDFTDDATKSLRFYFRWNQAVPLDKVIESLNNFEQIHLSVKGQTILIR